MKKCKFCGSDDVVEKEEDVVLAFGNRRIFYKEKNMYCNKCKETSLTEEQIKYNIKKFKEAF